MRDTARPGTARPETAPPPATPARDRAIDALRAFAILGVVLGHWLVTAFVGSGADLRVTSPLKDMPQFAPVSWVLQTLALFFLVGGYAAAKGLRPDEPWRRRFAHRLGRLARPLPILLAAWIPVAAVLARAGFDGATLSALVELVLAPLWFLAVFVALTALTPLVAALWDRLGARGAVLLVAATALVDAGRFALGAPEQIGWCTVLTGWLLPFYLGVGWARGALRSRRTAVALLAGGAAATAALVAFAGYPASMVGVPGADVSNLSPPTLAAVAFGLAQTGLALLLHGPLTRWTRRPRVWSAVSAANRPAMTVYLWHQTALMAVTVATAPAFGAVGGLHTRPDDAAWIVQRVAWLPVFAAVLAGLVTLVRRFERPGARAATRARPSAWFRTGHRRRGGTLGR
ncbi:acyltransferase family protein [Actinomadura sediminis]|uniref:Acyltransferase n=1 Tax=Actinomadura sediminis TaxID=1038904 RepID=A0ABW3EV62_9ACTN